MKNTGVTKELTKELSTCGVDQNNFLKCDYTVS